MRECVFERDAAIDRHRQHVRARLQVRVDILLKLREVDCPLLRDRRFHLKHRNPGRTLRPVVFQDRQEIFCFVLNRAGDENDCRRAAFARLQNFVAHRRPTARAFAVENRVFVALLWLVAQHQRHFSFQVDARVVVVIQRRRRDAVADERDLTAKRTGARHAERGPIGIGDLREVIAFGASDADLHAKRLPVRVTRKCRLQKRAQLSFDPVGGALDPLCAEPAPFHAVRGEDAHIVLELRSQRREKEQ